MHIAFLTPVYYSLLTELDICNSAPCRNGGTCITISLLDFICVCTEPFGGATCQDNFDMCGLTVPCENNGTCLNAGANAYTCLCPGGYTGSSCQLKEISGGEFSTCLGTFFGKFFFCIVLPEKL